MLTPQFTVTQSEDSVYIRIHIPHVRISGAEIVAENRNFTFYCKPYLLKLSLPAEVCDDENCHATYDPNDRNGTIVATLPKRHPGTHFPDLDLTTLLLQSRQEHDERNYTFPSIEVISEVSSVGDITEQNDGNCVMEAALPDCGLQLHSSSYGFNQKYSKVLSNLRDELIDVIRLRDPDSTPMRERRKLRLQTEKIEFDSNRYLGDLLEGSDDAIFVEAMAYQSRWDTLWNLWKDFQIVHPNMVTSNVGNVAASGVGGAAISPALPPPPPPALDSNHAQNDGPGDSTVALEKEEEWSVSRGLAKVFEASGGFSEEEQQTLRSLPRR